MEANKNKPNNNIDRRCFLTGCAKLALGASLFSLTRNSYGNYSDTWEDFSICIFKCPNPCNYDPACKGCRSEEKTDCTVKNCAIEKEMPSCAHCPDLKDCDKDLWINYPGQRQFALNKQAEWGLVSKKEIEARSKGFNVFPSEVNKTFTIKNASQLDVNYSMLNLEGRVVKDGSFKSSEYTVDISGLVAGSYILNVYGNNELYHVCKILKK